ncbi:xanthine dehydrogenase accessory protein XdhC [Malikia granosa]|uniref:Xanthine dehydrogenase accessory protein XdhC n=1 Tax=Malikia granosa TaxID=263067 RepID=A0A2S9K6L1_9BURK|nr:xanthine dehydrogenase accessory protein XdhC [Malikia granosa]PRD66100.1 xanthine dehydrogenase accessory protein XdhC [Malikia granosa]
MPSPAAASTDHAALLRALDQGPAVLVDIVATRGSTPREPGAWMALGADGLIGSVGGGHLELQAIAAARELQQQGSASPLNGQIRRYALGPALGQCCGGSAELQFHYLADAAAASQLAGLDPPRTPVAIFGAGHVGQALVQALLPLPFSLRWIDSRDGLFPARLPDRVQCLWSDPVQRALPELAPGSRVLIMSFSHAEDFELVAACLQRQRERADLPFIGLIGSRSKWASFRQRLQARGFAPQELEQVICPIGLPGIAGKQPAVIAASVAAQLLQFGSQAVPARTDLGRQPPAGPG